MNNEKQTIENFLGIEAYHIRLTLKSTVKIVEKAISELGKQYIICDEITHYHCYVVTQWVKKDISKYIKTTFNFIKGNADFSVVVVKNKNQMKKYILKDGNYIYNGFTENEIEILRKQSFKKGSDKFQNSLEKIEKSFYDGTLNFTQFGEQYVLLKIDYGQNLYGNHIKAYLNRVRMKNNPEYIKEYINELMR